MNILFYRYGSICEPDVIDGFLELGHQVSEITEEITNKTLLPSQTIRLISEYLEKDPHDLVFTINFYPAISEVCTLLKIPYVCWIVDSPVLELYTTSVTNPYNRIFLFDYTMYQEFAPLNPSCIFYLPLAVNVNAKQAVIWNTDADTRHSYASDATFLGSLYSEKCPYDTLHHPSDYSRGYLDAIMQAQLEISGYNFIEEVLPKDIVNEMQRVLQYDNRRYGVETLEYIFAHYVIDRKITQIERKKLLSAAAMHSRLRLYTLDSSAVITNATNMGPVSYTTEMPLIFHNSKINLNISLRSIRSGIPLRCMDILGAGGFLLTNYQADLFEHFTSDVDFVYYEDENDMLSKIDYYLTHDKKRKEIAANGYEKVLKSHTFTKRFAEILELSHIC